MFSGLRVILRDSVGSFDAESFPTGRAGAAEKTRPASSRVNCLDSETG